MGGEGGVLGRERPKKEAENPFFFSGGPEDIVGAMGGGDLLSECGEKREQYERKYERKNT